MSRDLILTGAWFLIVAAVSRFAWWVCRRVADSVHNSMQAAEHAMNASLYSHRAYNLLSEAWSEAVIVDQPPTEPFQPPTVPEHRAIARVDDVELAEAMAHIEAQFREFIGRPSPVKRRTA